MIYDLSGIEIADGGARRVICVCLGLLGAVHRRIERGQIVAYPVAFAGLWLLGTEPLKFDPIGNRLPFEIKHRMHRLYLNPPVPFLHRPPNQHGIVAGRHDEFVAVLHVCIFKRYLRFLLLFAIKVNDHPLFLTRVRHLLRLSTTLQLLRGHELSTIPVGSIDELHQML